MRLGKLIRLRIAAAIAKLASDPFLGKNLKGELKDYRSYRVGDYRVIYMVKRQRVLVEIIRVAHRREAYRR